MGGELYRISSIDKVSESSPSKSIIRITGLGNVTTMSVSPYDRSSTTLLFGDSSGKIVKATNVNTSSGTATKLADTGVSKKVSVSSITFGSDASKILVTYANYGLKKKIFYSTDGGSSWQNKMGNFPDMPIRSAAINPYDDSEVILATELGIWKTTNFGGSYPNWTPSNTGFANVRTDMLSLRRSDGKVLAATHGRGMFVGQFKGSSTLYSKPNLLSSDQVSISPNPAIDYLKVTLNMDDYKSLEFKLFSMKGELVHSHSYDKVMSIEHTIDVLGISQGSYILAVYGGNQELLYKHKILVKKGH